MWSVCVCGSYVRGDFIDRNSDLDINIVLKPTDTEGNPDDAKSSAGCDAVKDLAVSLLKGRTLHSHNPEGLDWPVVSHEWLPRRTEDVHLPRGKPTFPLLNIFLFDYLENLLVLWGNDPRKILPPPPDFSVLAREWFEDLSSARERYRRTGQEWRIPFGVFKSIQVAQIVFGLRTLDKRRLLSLYETYVPDFPLKEFGSKVIRDKTEQRYPGNPCRFAAYQDYTRFEDQLAQVVQARLGQP